MSKVYGNSWSVSVTDPEREPFWPFDAKCESFPIVFRSLKLRQNATFLAILAFGEAVKLQF